MAGPSNTRLCDACAAAKVKEGEGKKEGGDMTYASARDELVTRLVRAGELEISGESQEEADSYFNTENFAFHGPDGFDSDYAGLTEYFQSTRSGRGQTGRACLVSKCWTRHWTWSTGTASPRCQCATLEPSSGSRR